MSSSEVEILRRQLHELEIRIVKLEQLVRFVTYTSGAFTVVLQIYSVFFKG